MTKEKAECLQAHNEQALEEMINRLRRRLCTLRYGEIGISFIVHDGKITRKRLIDDEKEEA